MMLPFIRIKEHIFGSSLQEVDGIKVLQLETAAGAAIKVLNAELHNVSACSESKILLVYNYSCLLLNCCLIYLSVF